MTKIKVQNTEVTVIIYDDKDYISLTDMVRNIENGLALIEKWLRNKNTCLLYTSPSPRDAHESRMPSSA